MNGILNVFKPVGMSSFRCLSIVKRKLGLKKVGHLGTLDPLACGVLVLLCGSATKLNSSLSGGTKVYRSVFTFGIETDTLDNAGEIIRTCDVLPSLEQIKQAAAGLVGEVEIEVPRFSAVHIDGRRAYDLARSGEEFTPPKKTVHICRFDVIGFEKIDCILAPEVRNSSSLGGNVAEFAFEIECETGTYIRSLAKLLAARLGTVAIASTIIRTRVSNFSIEDAKPLETVALCDIIPV